MKKICFIAQFPPPVHGLSKAVDTLYNSYLSSKFEFEKVDITNNKRFLKNLFQIWQSRADLFYFTISQTKGGNFRDLIIFKLLSLQKKKCLIHLHGGYYRKLIDNDLLGWQKKMNYKTVKNLAGVIVLSPSMKLIFEGIIDQDKIYVIPNCVDNEILMSDEEFEEKVDVLDCKEILHVLYLSNFIKTKGYPEVLELAKLEKDRVAAGEKQRLHFNFAGKFFEESERKFFESYIEENELQDFVTYHGIVSGQQKKDLLKQCDIFILLTRYPNEGQPISILEAMGNGLLLVTTDHAGIPDIVKKGVNGIVCSANIQYIKNLHKEILLLSIETIKEYVVYNRREVLNVYREDSYIRSFKKTFGKFKD